jgi:hypothetical protein
MKETSNLELKENISKTFLKTVSAFANYEGGEILFGVRDDGKVVGLADLEREALNIENTINDSIEPNPDYKIEVNDDSTISLKVNSGKHKPYFYKSKAYIRHDTSTIEMDKLELQSLILESYNQSFDSIKSNQEKFSFDYLENKLKKELGIGELNLDILKTLELYSNEFDYYTIAGELFSDNNRMLGIDIARFNHNINIIHERKVLSGKSILKQLDDSISVFISNYQYEVIEGFKRNKYQKIPEEAFREAVANSLVHRRWDLNANIRIAMYEDKIEIISPGGLPKGITEEEYLKGDLSIIRNPIIANLFYRLDIIEQFGTGIRRINESYKKYYIKPQFSIASNHITITLPVIKTLELTNEEDKILSLIDQGNDTTKSLAEISGYSRSKVLMLLDELMIKNLVKKIGGGRSTKYKKVII